MDLVAVTPDIATQAMQKTYEQRTTHEVVASFALPFGIIAQGQIIKRAPGPILFRNPTIRLVQPHFKFDTVPMGGVRQISLRAPAQLVASTTTSPSLPGSAIMLKYPQGTPSEPISILGAGRDFNDDFGPSARGACIPARRVDISRLWRASRATGSTMASTVRSTQQVDFDVVLGRNERTMIQVLYISLSVAADIVVDVSVSSQESAFMLCGHQANHFSISKCTSLLAMEPCASGLWFYSATTPASYSALTRWIAVRMG